MDRSIRSRTSSTSSLRSPALPSTPAPTPTFSHGRPSPASHLPPTGDQLCASISRLSAERLDGRYTPATPVPTPNPAHTSSHHTLHPDALLAGLSSWGGDEGIASSSVPGTPAPTPFSPSPSVNQSLHPDQMAAAFARLREEGGVSSASTQPVTPSTTPGYPPPYALPGPHNLGIIPEHLAEGIACLGRGQDEGLESGSNPCTPTPTPFSPSPAQHSSLLAEQLAAGIHRLKVEEGMSSGGSTGMPATPAPTPFSHGPGGVRPEELAAGISRLSVIQEADTAPVAINVLDESASSNINNLSNYFGTPTANGESAFDTIATPGNRGGRLTGEAAMGFHDITISTPAHKPGVPVSPGPWSPSQATTTPSSVASPFAVSPMPPGISPLPPMSPTLPNNQLDLLSPASTISVYATPAAQTPITGGPSETSTPSTSGQEFGTNPEFSIPVSSGAISPFPNSQTPHHPITSPLQQPITSPLQQPITSPLQQPITSPLQQPITSPLQQIQQPITSPLQQIQQPITSPLQQHLNSPGTQVPCTLPLPQKPDRPISPSTGHLPSTEDTIDEAWIPCASSKEVLDSMAATPGTFYPARDQLTCPGVSPASEQGDPVKDLVTKYQGEAESSKRQILSADGVTADKRGLQQLLSAGNYRAAVNLTAQLLTMYGQGVGGAGQLSKHSPTSLQLWWTRLALLVKLRLFSIADREAAPFSDLEKPDLFYQYYPEIHGSRRGSMVPWAMRLLLSELPQHQGKYMVATNNLFKLLASVRRMLANIEAALLPDGGVWLEAKQEERDMAVSRWRSRERQVLRALVNCSLSGGDYESAVKCLDMLAEVEEESKQATLMSAYGRLYLQLGNLVLADTFFTKAAKLRSEGREGELEGLLDSGFLAVGQGQFDVALERFQAAVGLSSGGCTAAITNNIAVCLLYVGKLKEGLQLLESNITSDQGNMQASPLLNLCTLYELESSYASQKKIGMLGLVSQYCSDSFNTSSLKL